MLTTVQPNQQAVHGAAVPFMVRNHAGGQFGSTLPCHGKVGLPQRSSIPTVRMLTKAQPNQQAVQPWASPSSASSSVGLGRNAPAPDGCDSIPTYNKSGGGFRTCPFWGLSSRFASHSRPRSPGFAYGSYVTVTEPVTVFPSCVAHTLISFTPGWRTMWACHRPAESGFAGIISFTVFRPTTAALLARYPVMVA